MKDGRAPTGQALVQAPSPTVSALTGFDPSRKRNWRGQFIKVLRSTPDGSREWLIWSRYHAAWHCRDEGGRAAGYTADIARAGLFPRDKASSYNDGDRNEPFHVSEKMPLIRAAIAQHDKALAALRAIAMSGSAQDRNGLGSEGAPARASQEASPKEDGE